MSYALRADVTPPTMEQAGSVFPDLVEASMTEMRLRSKMAASCLGYSFARSQTNLRWDYRFDLGEDEPHLPLRNAPGLLNLVHYVSLSCACIGPSVLFRRPNRPGA